MSTFALNSVKYTIASKFSYIKMAFCIFGDSRIIFHFFMQRSPNFSKKNVTKLLTHTEGKYFLQNYLYEQASQEFEKALKSTINKIELAETHMLLGKSGKTESYEHAIIFYEEAKSITSDFDLGDRLLFVWL